jgi:plasmid maintenance system antidote protein VapI
MVKSMKQTTLAKKANISDGFLSQLIARKKSLRYETAKRLAEITGTDVSLWFEGTTKEIRAAIKGSNSHD